MHKQDLPALPMQWIHPSVNLNSVHPASTRLHWWSPEKIAHKVKDTLSQHSSLHIGVLLLALVLCIVNRLGHVMLIAIGASLSLWRRRKNITTRYHLARYFRAGKRCKIQWEGRYRTWTLPLQLIPNTTGPMWLLISQVLINFLRTSLFAIQILSIMIPLVKTLFAKKTDYQIWESGTRNVMHYVQT